MFARIKPAGKYRHLQIVQSKWEQGGPRQYVIATLGRMDLLPEKNQLEGIIRSLAKFFQRIKVREEIEEGTLTARSVT